MTNNDLLFFNADVKKGFYKLLNLKYIILVSFLIFLNNSFSQKKFYIKYRGENNETINVVDSLSYQEENTRSEYFVDSLTGEAYTGLVTRINKNYLDSLSIQDGYKSGISKEFFIYGKAQLKAIYYYNNERNIYFSRTYKICWENGCSKNKHCSIWITIPEGNNAFSFKLIQKKGYLQLTSWSYKKKMKRKFNTKADLLNFMNDFYLGEVVYKKALAIGIFEGIK